MIHSLLLSLGSIVGIGMASLQMIILAYIDPNTGGMLFQVLAVLFGVISGALLLFSGKIKGYYYRIRRRVQGSDDEIAIENTDTQENE
jgi:hypothetical protein